RRGRNRRGRSARGHHHRRGARQRRGRSDRGRCRTGLPRSRGMSRRPGDSSDPACTWHWQPRVVPDLSPTPGMTTTGAETPEGGARVGRRLEAAARAVTVWTGSSSAFAAAVLVVLVWAILGPIFHFSDTWQLVINTGTTIVTFLMVFLI